MNWFDCLQAFISVAEQNSFSKAARQLKTSASEISKRIQWLEYQFETPVFIRTTRQVKLTEEGRYLLKRVKPLLDQWDVVKGELLDFQTELSGELMVCMPPQLYKVPSISAALAAFNQHYPRVNLMLTTRSGAVSLVKGNIDIVIGLEKNISDPATVIGVSLFDFHYMHYAAPKYLNAMPVIHTVDDLTAHNCLIYRHDNKWQFDDKVITVTGNFHADSSDVLLKACLEGIGILRIASVTAKSIEPNTLEEILPGASTRKQQVKIFYPNHPYLPRKITAFLEVIKKFVKV